MRSAGPILLLLAALLAAPPAHAFGDPFHSVAKGVARAAGEGKVERVAVLPFVASNGQHPEDGTVMSDRLIGELVRLKGVRVVERGMLESLMKEHYLSATGVVSPEGRRQLGKVLSVDAIVIGSYLSLGRRASMNTRLIKVDTGDILYADTRRLTIDWFDPSPIDAPSGLLWHQQGDEGCRDAQERLDALERELAVRKTSCLFTPKVAAMTDGRRP